MSEKNAASKICFIGGDERQLYAAVELSSNIDNEIVVSGETFSNHLDLYGKNVTYIENPLKAIHIASAVILPLPASKIEKELSFVDVVEEMKRKDGIIIGGRFSPYMLDLMDEEGLRYADYFEDENFNIKNAFITAEGAVHLAMSSLNIMLRDARCTVLGFGRIGKALGQMLMSLGCRTTIYARREEVRVLAREMGFIAVGDIDLKEADIIFNTVPQRIISNDDLLGTVDKKILIELASAPGGFDPDIAMGCSHTVVDGKALPGRYAPASAGKSVAESIFSILERIDI